MSNFGMVQSALRNIMPQKLRVKTLHSDFTQEAIIASIVVYFRHTIPLTPSCAGEQSLGIYFGQIPLRFTTNRW